MMTKLHQLALAAALLCAAGTARADTLYYGGDVSYFMPGASYGGYNDASPYDDYRAFDSFTVPTGQTWYVTGLFANIGNPDYAANPHPKANWWITSGLTMASMGTVIASGAAVDATTALNGIDLNGGSATGELMSVDLGGTVTLAGGNTYSFAIQPISTSYYHMFVGGTVSNANAIGGPLDHSANIYFPGSSQVWSFDLSQGVTGTLTDAPPVETPEPASAALLGSFLLGAMSLRRAAGRGRPAV
jgi:hypothetical protein